MKNWIAFRLNRVLLGKDFAGQPARPGAGSGQRWRQADGAETAIVAQGDAFDFYIGKGDTIHNVTLDNRTAVALMKWLLCWWVWRSWCGLRLKLWYWSLGVIMEPANEQKQQATSLVGQRTL